MSTPYWGPDFDALAAVDPDIAGVVLAELDRLRSGPQLIASENSTSPAVLVALGSTLSNKYAKGYPGARYYGGCEVVDRVVANAQALTDGLAAEGLRPVAGGTDTHLALLDLGDTGVPGAEAEARCGAAGIVLNKNAVPFDPRPASIASGIRVGSPIGTAIRDTDGSRGGEVRAAVGELVGAHPGYPRPAKAV